MDNNKPASYYIQPKTYEDQRLKDMQRTNVTYGEYKSHYDCKETTHSALCNELNKR